MRTKTKSLLLTALLSGLFSTSFAADGDLLNENFSGFEGINSNNVVRNVNNWTLMGCGFLKNNLFPSSISFDYYYSDGHAYAISPSFSDFTGTKNAILTFKCARQSNSNPGEIKITINGSGNFENGEKTHEHVATGSSTAFINHSFKLFGVTSETSLTFTLTSEKAFVLDDVKVSTADAVTLSESEANSLNEKTADITLTRTLKGGIWNTLCLPFAVSTSSLAKALGNEQDIQLRTFSSYADNAINLVATENIAAGTPFLIKLNTTVTNPTFQLADMETKAAQTVTNNGVSMVGVYSPTNLPDNGMFLSATDGKLKKPSGSNKQLKGLRAYFIVPNGAGNARIIIDGNDVTAISEPLFKTEEKAEWYSLDGLRQNQRPAQKGIYINNGKKLMIK